MKPKQIEELVSGWKNSTDKLQYYKSLNYSEAARLRQEDSGIDKELRMISNHNRIKLSDNEIAAAIYFFKGLKSDEEKLHTFSKWGLSYSGEAMISLYRALKDEIVPLIAKNKVQSAQEEAGYVFAECKEK